MVTTVIAAFTAFQSTKVNLDSADTREARQDRDNLRARIQNFQTTVEDFPVLYTQADVNFGSFSRRTKKRPLDDVDMFFCIAAEGAVYDESNPDSIILSTDNSQSKLRLFTNSDGRTLNSTRILNKFKASVANIYHYRRAELNRRGEAVVLDLVNKDWSFDIVPCFKTTEYFGKTFYIIPNGSGGWKKADPRIDKERVTRINTQNSGNVLNAIRIIKYWNKRPTMPSMGSYLLECMVLDYYEGRTSCSEFVDIELPSLFRHIASAVYGRVSDPKGYQGDLNVLSWDERVNISARAMADFNRSVDARTYENDKNMERSISKWREIFGAEFPEYG
jgi:hypothetical protein